MRVNTIRWTGFIAAPSSTLSKDVGTGQGLGVDIDMGNPRQIVVMVCTRDTESVYIYTYVQSNELHTLF